MGSMLQPYPFTFTHPVKSKRRKGKTLRKALRLAADSIAVSSRTVRMSSLPKSRSFARGYPNY